MVSTFVTDYHFHPSPLFSGKARSVWAPVQKALSLHANVRLGLKHRDMTRASTLCFYFIKFFSAFEHVKSLLIMGPNDIKNSSLKCDFHIINYE
jgi:hypothetical protein